MRGPPATLGLYSQAAHAGQSARAPQSVQVPALGARRCHGNHMPWLQERGDVRHERLTVPLLHVRGAASGRQQCRLRLTPTRASLSAGAASLSSPLMAAALSATPGLALGAAVNAAVFLAGLRVLLRGLTPSGVAHAAVLGTLVYAAFGPGGYALVCVYFLAGSAVTKLRLAQKQAEGIAEARSGRRSPASVWGSGIAGVACAAAALACLPPGAWLWRLGFVASFASKLGDTTSSEVGKAYGRTTYLCTTLARVPRGTEGAVSAEGTAAGVVAAAAFASLALALGQVDAAGWVACVVAAFLANTAESIVGATVQGRVAWLTNDVVNGLQITLAAALALALRLLAAA